VNRGPYDTGRDANLDGACGRALRSNAFWGASFLRGGYSNAWGEWNVMAKHLRGLVILGLLLGVPGAARGQSSGAPPAAASASLAQPVQELGEGQEPGFPALLFFAGLGEDQRQTRTPAR